MQSDLKHAIIARARAEGFSTAGICAARFDGAEAGNLARYIQNGFHGDMSWMAETEARRKSPDTMWPEAKSAIILALNYGPGLDPLERLRASTNGVISVYALGHDYHDLIKKKLKRIARWLAESQKCQVKVFVDTAPLMEKPLAQAAGLGWQGKHTNLVSQNLGSWFFLGTILTDLELEPDRSESDHCGTCSACLDVCPTNAFPAPHQIDARRCISYLTIEHKDHIPREFRQPMGNRIYGCDDCLAVCPWNRFAQLGQEAKLAAREELKEPPLSDLVKLKDMEFRELFRASPVKRIGRNRFIRNVLIAIGNSEDNSLVPSVRSLLRDDSPLVRAMAIWALVQLLESGEFTELREAHKQKEEEAAVRAEWEAV